MLHASQLIYWLSMMRALTPETPVILCPAMNTHMYQHPFTADHLKTVQEKLHYMISGPQGSGALACGDEGEFLPYPFGFSRVLKGRC